MEGFSVSMKQSDAQAISMDSLSDYISDLDKHSTELFNRKRDVH